MVQSWLVADKLYELVKWKFTKINQCKQVKKQQQLDLPNIKLQREGETHTKTENSPMFAINYLSLNTKSGYKDFRSLSFLIDSALAVLLIFIMEAFFNSLQFEASNWLNGVKFLLKYNIFTGLKGNLLLSKLCKLILFY